jgi:hypothetical protein
VADERRYLEKPLRIIQATAGLALLAVLPWWLALILAGALALGWLPLALALAALAASGSVTVTAIAIPLAILGGARWTFDGRQPLTLAAALTAFTLFLLGVAALGLRLG